MIEEKEKKEIDMNDAQVQNGSGINILLIDDDKFLLDMYALKFKKAGIAVEAAFSSLEALKKLREGFSPDIILLDIIMPGMDGLELLKTVRSEKLALKSTIIILTNQADDTDKAKALGANGFIVKAMNIPSEVVNQVMEIYKNKKKS